MTAFSLAWRPLFEISARRPVLKIHSDCSNGVWNKNPFFFFFEAMNMWGANVRKRINGHLRPAKIQISLRIYAAWPESSLEAFWIGKNSKFLHVDNEGSDQTVRMCRLIWVRWVHTCQKVRFLIFIVAGYYGFMLDVRVSVHLSVRPSHVRLSVCFSFPDDNLSKHQCIFTKLGMCIDIVEIWFGIANGQISSNFYRVICPRHTHIFVSGWYLD